MFKCEVGGVSSDTSGAEQTTLICEWCGLPITESDQRCPALDDKGVPAVSPQFSTAPASSCTRRPAVCRRLAGRVPWVGYNPRLSRGLAATPWGGGKTSEGLCPSHDRGMPRARFTYEAVGHRVTMGQLQRQDTTGLVSIPHHMLELDGLLDEDGKPREGQSMMVNRLDERCYLVRAVDGDVPEVENCEVVKQLVAQKTLHEDVLGQPAD